jgi:enoyl-CoA hydratase
MSKQDITRVGTLTWQVDGAVGIVTLDRPERMNTLGGTMKADLAQVFLELARNDDAVNAIVMTGAGDRAFCAGADIKERATEVVKASRYVFTQRATHDLFRDIEEFEKPVIAAINGVALGGGLELALCCDIRIAADHARLGLPEVKLGAIPGAGGTQRLPRAIGEARAKELIFTAEMIGAQEALRIGLVNRVVPQAALLDSALAMARQIAGLPPLAVRLAKRTVNRGMQTDLDSGLEYERYAAGILLETEDRIEGMRAFTEKRAPVFTGR